MDPDIGEFELIERFFRFSKDKGVPFAGDDCAYLEVGAKTLAVTGDTLVEGVHFFADDAPEDVAWKILNVNLSDLAVCGARPLGCLLQASLPGFDGKWLSAFSRSLQKACETHDIPLIGGDTVKAPDKAPKTFGLTAFGETEFRIRRSGAKPGDDIWVTGHLGMASCALELITTGRKAPETFRRRLARGGNRLELGRGLAPFMHAACDVSDGLLADLGHILAASGTGAVLEAGAVPLHADRKEMAGAMTQDEILLAALTGGDDYELLFAASPDEREAIRSLARRDVPVTRIGAMTETRGLALEGVSRAFEEKLASCDKGYEHKWGRAC